MGNYGWDEVLDRIERLQRVARAECERAVKAEARVMELEARIVKTADRLRAMTGDAYHRQSIYDWLELLKELDGHEPKAS